ncbi:MAG TPA: trigger factor [Candidatus Sulfotelmatobacter sp.]|nr:trigger factor [Candidatus Sulfotelmatobacter sp.]
MTTSAPVSELNVSVEPRPASQVEVTVEAPAGEFDAAVTAAQRRLASRVRVPGFRPGKAPGPMVERAVGWETVRSEALQQLLPELLQRALEQAGVEAVDEPDLKVVTAERGQPLSFSAAVTVKPEVDLGDYPALRVEHPQTEIGDDKVDEALEEVRRRHSTLKDVDRPAQAGDVVRATLVMRRGDDPIVAAGEAAERDIELDREKLIPGLMDGIIGLVAGDDRSFQLTLPEDFPQDELRGVEVTADVHVTGVRERVLPPLDDALAERDGHGPTVTELRDHYRQALSNAAERHDEELFRSNVLTALRDQATVDVPEVMVDQEIDRQLGELERRLISMGMSLDRYLEYTGSSREQLRGERRAEAALRVKLQLVLDALAAAEGLEVDENQVEREQRQIAGERKLTAEQRRRLRDIARTDLLRRAAIDRALEIARGEG